MTKDQKAKLYTAVREVYLQQRKKGHNTNKEILDIVEEKYPELIERHAKVLCRRSVGQILRGIRKSESKNLKSPQFVLPMAISDLKLPADISLPPIDDGEAEWQTLEDATIAELEAHLGYLSSQIAADWRRHRELEKLRRYLLEHTNEEQREWAIGVILRELAKLDRKAS